jgi:AcrR family transcriptional regulator
MNNVKKKSRARSPEKKREQFDRILEEGKDMFVKYGTHGFSTRILAEKLGMTQPNLYNYVSSKRELWIAIRTKYYIEYSKGIQDIIREYKKRPIEMFYKMAEYFLEYAGEDYKRYQIMFVLSAPPSKKIGPLEKKYKPFEIMKVMLDQVSTAIDAGNIISDKTIELFYSLYSYIYGAAKMEADLKVKSKVSEPIVGDRYSVTAQEFREFVLKELRERLERIRM